MKKIVTILIISLISLNSETIKAKRVKAKDRSTSSRHHSSGNIQEDILFSSFEATAHISTELSFALSTEATSYSSMEERRKKIERRERYIESNRQNINLNIAQGGGEHLSALLHLLELKENKRVLTSIQSDFGRLSGLDNRELWEALIEVNS